MIFVFEINPRFSGTIFIRALAGYDEPDVLIRHEVLGEYIKLPITFNEGLCDKRINRETCKGITLSKVL